MLDQEVENLKKDNKELSKSIQNNQNSNLNEVKNLNSIITAKENELLNLKFTHDKEQALQAQKVLYKLIF